MTGGAAARAESYSLYIVRCSDDTLYTGIAVDVGARLRTHESGAGGAKYLRGRRPITLVYQRRIGSRGAAQRAEARIKKLSRAAKLALIDGRLRWRELGILQTSGSSSG
ncbi:MAG: GIY-YIG nuclease family protein [Woeseiaceae bacterium]|nr:GIY-YIG nuclease family protein [Woeseiaceae bacterium]